MWTGCTVSWRPCPVLPGNALPPDGRPKAGPRWGTRPSRGLSVRPKAGSPYRSRWSGENIQDTDCSSPVSPVANGRRGEIAIGYGASLSCAQGCFNFGIMRFVIATTSCLYTSNDAPLAERRALYSSAPFRRFLTNPPRAAIVVATASFALSREWPGSAKGTKSRQWTIWARWTKAIPGA